MQEINNINIIAIDGTSASGKGSLARAIAKYYNYNYLNSGALYRLSAYLAMENKIDITDHANSNLDNIVQIFNNYKDKIIFDDKKVLVDGIDIWSAISTQTYGNRASMISFYPPLRYAIRDFQRLCIKSPGLVAEGRDMTTEVFKDAKYKIYLDASLEVRVERRKRDEDSINSGKSYDDIFNELKVRDSIDKGHIIGALKISDEAFVLDTTNLTVEQSLEKCIEYINSTI